MKKGKGISEKKRKKILFLIIPMVLLAIILSYIIITKHFLYEDYSTKFMTTTCYTEKSVLENTKYEVINKVKSGETIVCKIAYELPFLVSKLSYDLDYSDNLSLVSESKKDSLVQSEKHYMYNYSSGVFFDESPLFTFKVKEDATNNVYINIQNIKFLTVSGKYYKGKENKHPIEIDNNKKKIYLYQNDSGDYYYLSEKRDDYWNMIDIYECNDDKCTAMMLDNDDNSYVISDEKLIFNKFNSSKYMKEISENSTYHIVLPNNDEHIIKYYSVSGKDVYTFEKVNNKRGIGTCSLNGFIANYDEIGGLRYNLSFTNDTLKDGYVLVDDKKDSKKSYIYDFVNQKVVYEVKTKLSYFNYFNKIDNGYKILIENPDDLEVIYLTKEFKNRYDHLIIMDDNYHKYSNGNLLFKENGKYFLYQEDGTFIRNIFEKINPTYIYVNKDNIAMAIVWDNSNNYFTLYDEDSNEIKKSNEYEKIYFVNEEIYVLKDNYFTIIDYNEKVLQQVVEMTDNIVNVENYDGIMSFRNKEVPEGEKGSYIVYYFNSQTNKLIKEELDYEWGGGN